MNEKINATIDVAIQKLEIDEGDILIVKFEKEPSSEMISQINGCLRGTLDGKNRWMLIGPGIDFQILTKSDIEARAQS